MIVTVAAETSIDKKILGSFDSPESAALFVKSLLQDKESRKEYIKLIVELQEVVK